MAAKKLPRFTRHPEDAEPPKSSNGIKTKNGESTTPTSVSASSNNPSSQTQSSGTRAQTGTLRFMLDANSAREEENIVDKYYKDEEEEYEVEIPATEARTESRGAHQRDDIGRNGERRNWGC